MVIVITKQHCKQNKHEAQMKEYLPTEYRTRVLLPSQTCATAAIACALPTGSVNAITLRSIAKKGIAAALTLSLVSADNAAGTNPVAYPVAVPLYVGGVRQADATSYAITPATGNFIVDFCVDPATIPDGKFVGISYANSDVANFLVTMIAEDCAFSSTVS
jgi:hypothetical protein